MNIRRKGARRAATRRGSRKMARRMMAPFGLAAMLMCGTAIAAPFKCPKTGGDFVFGQEANLNSLDQMTSSTISTRNVAMNIFEAL
ncbi:MAG TPA: hypothetical protein VGC80_08010, partial [Acetobacteraceae bacterium]